MNSVSLDIADKLLSVAPTVVSGTKGGTADWSIFINSQPTKPVNVFSVWDTPGRPPSYSFDKSKNPLKYSAFQLRTRGTNHDTSRAKLEAAVKALVQLGRFLITGSDPDVIYMNISETGSDIIPLTEQDNKDNFLWAANLTAIRREKDA